MNKHKSISYSKWGYIFIAPFFLVYAVCSLFPLLSTIYNSFFENYRTITLEQVNTFVGFKNYTDLFTPDSAGQIEIVKYAGNTIIMWIMGAVPQIILALALALWFTSTRLNIKGQRFFKTVIYMPNLIMASAFAMLFLQLFSSVGPINGILQSTGAIDKPIYFFDMEWSARGLIAFVNFLMWFGNTTILLMAGIMGIDQSLFEAASIDGAKSSQVFFKITLPLLMPILVYVVITALIGGLQMYDVPQIMTENGAPAGTTKTLIMFLNEKLTTSKNYGVAGALSVLMFIFTGILSFFVYRSLVPRDKKNKKRG